MLQNIETRIDRDLNAIIVRLPNPTTLEQLVCWKPKFLELLAANEPDCSSLLLDTGQHNFENIACLKFLKETLTQDPIVQRVLRRAAFVQPASLRSPSVVSNSEAYYSTFAEALSALRKPDFL